MHDDSARKMLHKRLSALKARLEQVGEELGRLEIERNLIEEIMSDLPNEPPGPRQAVLEWVAEHPGQYHKQILDALEEKVKTNAKDVRATLTATIHALRAAGKLKRDREHRLYVNVKDG